MKDQIEFNFVINDKGNFVFQGNEIREVLNKNKGKRGVASIIFFDERDPKQIIGYYKAYVIPKIKKAIYEIENTHHTDSEVESIIWGMSAVTKEKPRDIYSLSVYEIWLFLEEIKMIAARDFNVYIE